MKTTMSLMEELRFAMRSVAIALLFCIALCCGAQMNIRGGPAHELDIPGVLYQSAEDWNSGNLDAFATSYKDSPDILFIGKKMRHGYAQMLAAYKAGYPTREKMGTLSFTQLAVQPLDTNFATVTGHFHLERTAAGGGNADGYFLLVMERTRSGWKIVRDDTTELKP
jgi:ketosteroid isomerase-like protein